MTMRYGQLGRSGLAHLGVSLVPYFPLARGLLTGKYRRGEPAPPGSRLAGAARLLEAADFDRIEAVAAFAEQRSVGMLDVAIGGLLANPVVGAVIAGATSAEQVTANAAAGEWSPSADDVAALDALTAAGGG